MPHPAPPSIPHRGLRPGTAALRHLLGCLAVVLLAATGARAEVGVVYGDPEELAPARRAAVQAVEAALDDYGLPHTRVDEALLSERTLRAFDLIVLPLSRVGQGEALRAFAGRGGRWVAYQAAGDPLVHTVMGLQVAAPLEGPAPTAVIPEPRPGTPAKVVLGPGASLPLRAADPSYEAGRWDRTGGEVSALVRGPHGYYANFAPASTAGQAPFLVAMLADLEPSLWEAMLAHARTRSSVAVGAAGLRWTHARQQPGWTDDQRGGIERALRALRGRVPEEGLGPLEISSNRRVAAERVEAARRVAAETVQLSYRMAAPRKGELRALWVPSAGKTDWEAVLRKARDTGLNAVFVRISAAPGGAAELKAAIETARKYGLALHAGRDDLDLASAAPELLPKLAAEDRLVRGPDGRQGVALNPGDPRNQELALQAALEVVRAYDVDGFHFGALRYPDQPHTDWDYGSVSRREFEKATGKAVTRWPDEVLSGPRKREYDDWQRENLNRLVQRCYQELKKVKPYVQVSASVDPRPRQARAAVKQDWPLWIERGWLDFVVPLEAVRDPDVLAAAVDEQVSAARGKAPVVAGLATSLAERPLDLVRQVEITREQGSDGFVLFPGAWPELDPQLAALRAGATAEGTWPGYLAPEIEWVLSPTVERKYAPLAFALGDRIPFEAKLSNISPSRVAVRSGEAELRLEDLQGRLMVPLGTMNSFNVRRVRLEVPAGKFRPVLRGSLTYMDGTVRPFVVRGPVCEGLPGEELSALRGREAPPVVAGDGRRVAVYAGGAGAAALLQLLGNSPGIRAFPLHRLRADHLAVSQALVLSEWEDAAELTAEGEQALRAWVAAGGTLVLTHDAVGARWHPRLFPEVGSPAGLAAGGPLELVEAVGDQKAGTTFEPSAGDLWRIRPGEGAQVLVREGGPNGAPVAVSGRVGKGRVILYGAAPGYGSRDGAETEEILFRLLVRSSTGP